MSISAEQFNKLVTKEEHLELKEKVGSIDDKIDVVMEVLDGIAKDVKDSKVEKLSNQAAHDRMQGEIVKIKDHVGL